MRKIKKLSFLALVYLMAFVLLVMPMVGITATAETTLEGMNLQELYDAYKDTELGDYTEDSYTALTSALEQAREALYGIELLKDTSKWYVVQPGVGSPINKESFDANNYGYDFPIIFTDNGEYLNMVLTSHGLYEGNSTNWQGRQNYYILDNAIEVDFTADYLDFKYAVYNDAAKNPFIQPVTVLHFADLGTVYLENSNDNYMTGASAGIGRVYSGNIAMSELKSKMTADQITALEANGNKATLTRVDLYHNPDGLWNTYGADKIFGIDIYKFNVIDADISEESAKATLLSAINGLSTNTESLLKGLYNQYKDTERGYYTEDSYAALTSALKQAREALYGIELLKDTSKWHVVQPGVGSPINKESFDANNYGYDFPIIFTDNGEYLNMVLTSHGLYEGDATNWQSRQNYYILDNAIEVDFTADYLDFKYAVYNDAAKNPFIQPVTVLHFAELGTVYLENSNDNYMTGASAGIGRVYSGNIAMSELKSKMTADQITALEANGNKATLTRVDLYHNGSGLWNTYGADKIFGIDIYKFRVYDGDYTKESACEALEAAINGLSVDLVYDELKALYDEYANASADKYSAESFAALTEALKIAKATLDRETVKVPVVTDTTKFLMPGKNSAGELLQFRTAEEFAAYYPNDALPFIISSTDEYTKIGFNKESIGFCYPSIKEDGSYEGVWGMPMTKYTLAGSPIEIDFNRDKLTVDIAWVDESNPGNLNYQGSVSLFFKNIGEWIELSTVANATITGRYQATIDLSAYYASLADDSAAKQYLDGNGGTDQLLGMVFRFGDIYYGNNDYSIYVHDFTVNKKYTTYSAMNALYNAVENLEFAVNGDANDDDEIDINDLVYIRKALLGIDGFTMVDVNGDGNTDIIDLIVLKKYLAKTT